MMPVVSRFVYIKINNLIVSDKWNAAIRILKKISRKNFVQNIFVYGCHLFKILYSI